MNFSKISFEGKFNSTFYDVKVDYYGGLKGDLVLKSDGFYIKGNRIPIRKTLWGSFENEFIMAVNSNKNNLSVKFLITPDDGYMIKRPKDKLDSFMSRLVNLGFDDSRWESPCLGESKY